jgi:thioredoxin 1
MAQVVNTNDFDEVVLKSSNVTLVDFYADWCGPCQMLIPIIDELSENLPTGTNVVKVNVDESGELAARYGVMGIPSLKVFKDGEVVEEATGVLQKDQLIEMLKRHL